MYAESNDEEEVDIINHYVMIHSEKMVYSSSINSFKPTLPRFYTKVVV